VSVSFLEQSCWLKSWSEGARSFSLLTDSSIFLTQELLIVRISIFSLSHQNVDFQLQNLNFLVKVFRQAKSLGGKSNCSFAPAMMPLSVVFDLTIEMMIDDV